MAGAERSRMQQFRSRHGCVVLGGQRIAGEVGAVSIVGGRLRRQEIVLELQHLRRTARRVAGVRVDRNALEIIAGAVDEIAVVELEVAAAGVAVDAVEHRHVVGEGAGLLHLEEAVAVDRHVGRDRRGLHVALHRVGGARLRGDAAGELRGQRGLRNEIEETGVDALERRGLRVRDVAGNVFQREGLRLQAANRRRKCAEDTHDIFSNFDPGRPADRKDRGRIGRTCRKRHAKAENYSKINYLNKKPRSKDRGTIAGRATIAGRKRQVADGAAGWNTSAKPSMQ